LGGRDYCPTVVILVLLLRKGKRRLYKTGRKKEGVSKKATGGGKTIDVDSCQREVGKGRRKLGGFPLLIRK